ncbi:MAG: hypothetical protein LQ344_004784 [Seirophora lacunosa]|nr:MAG: hypothetical protein LQ344_004784 [Seirophora lacunosa]
MTILPKRLNCFSLSQRRGYYSLLFRASPSRLDYLLLVVGILAAIGAGIPFPLLGIIFGELVDDLNSMSCDASQTANTSGVAGSIQEKVLLLVYISLGNFFAIYLHTLCWSLFGERLVSRLRRQYFQSLLRQEMAFFDKLPAGEVPTRLTSDMEIIRVGTSEKVGIFISSFAYLIGAYVVAFLKAPSLAAMLVFMIPAYILMVSVGGFYVGKFTRRTSHHLAAAASIVSQSLSNITLIHALGADQRLESKITSILSKAQHAALRKASAAAMQFGFTFLVAYSANAIAFWQGSQLIAQAAEGSSNVTAGGIYSVIFVLLDASFVISQIAPFLQTFGAAAAAAQALSSVADRNSKIDGTKTATDQVLSSIPSDIVFDQVTFAYPSRPEVQVLKGVSLNFAQGKFTAIVGASGSGKSTLGGLMTRLYDPDTGTIALGGQNTTALSVRQLRQRVATVDQDAAILCCSVLENIAYGAINAGRLDLEQHRVERGHSGFHPEQRVPNVQQLFQKVQHAATLADADGFIQNLQHGYATLVGTGGVELSGGQQQRLALARALVRDPEILLLDEATSALDSISEQKILNSLKENRNGKTTITIAHRLGTIKEADRIIVMHDGRVIEEGIHDSLLERDGRYKAMSETQSLSSLVSAQSSEVSTIAPSAISSELKAVRPTFKRGSLKSFRDSFRRDSHVDSEGKLDSHSRWTGVRMFSRLARPQLLFLVIGILGATVAGGSYSADAVIFGTTISQLDACRGSSMVKSAGSLAGLLFFILALSAFLANSIGGSAFGRVAEKVVFRIRILTFRSLMHQDVRWHTSGGRTPAVLLSYFTADTSALAGLSGVVMGTILTILVNLVASIVMTHIIAWKIAVVLLATLPILLGSGFMRLWAVSNLQVQHQRLYARPAGISLEAVASIKTIAGYSLEGVFYERYRHSLQAPYKASLRGLAYTNFWLATAYSVSFLIYALAYWWGARQILAGTYSQTQFFIVLPALLFSAQSCGQMFALAPDVSNARLAAVRLFNLIKSEMNEDSTPPSLSLEEKEKDPEKDPTNPPPVPPPTEPSASSGMRIEMHNVTFAYPERPTVPILNNLSLTIPAGQFCALVGPSGAGKSTIISLLESFHVPTSGTIHLDNTFPLTSTHSTPHRASISLVPQTSTLFSDTIRFNIGLGAHPSRAATDAEIVSACESANIHSTIAALPHGYDTQCGAVTTFSGGQKQRLCIARGLVRAPRLLLLDEPTSALDTEAEASLQRTIEGLRGRMTVLVVAHRLCTVRRADRIFWIEGGRCVCSGTHEEMLRGCEGYRESARCQAVG